MNAQIKQSKDAPIKEDRGYKIEEVKAWLASQGYRVSEAGKPKVDPARVKEAKRAVLALLARDFPEVSIGAINVFKEDGEKPKYKNPETGEIYQHKGGKGAKKPEWATKANRVKD
ncbi:MAG: hypothetical protein C0519_00530 [Hyphomicrobium sp.]|nr:hypothetical protein [Hyphomicrobium sp.]PPD08026.1 MAG: hypothetical protein CTY28_07030 [Hyphomicrobium sp.]